MSGVMRVARRAARKLLGTLRDGRRAIVLLTDGEDTASIVSDEQVIDLARRAGVVLCPIGLLAQSEEGHLGSPVPANFLKALARETGGRAYFPKTLSSSKRRMPRSPASCARSTASATCRSTRAPTATWRRLAVKARRNDRNLTVRHPDRLLRAGRRARVPDPACVRSLSWRGSPRRFAAYSSVKRLVEGRCQT
jgi:hypothetical protein